MNSQAPLLASQRVVQVCLFLIAAIFLLALGVLLAGVGRLVSMSQVGLPTPSGLWLAYVGSELVLPVVLFTAHMATRRHATRAVPAAA